MTELKRNLGKMRSCNLLKERKIAAKGNNIPQVNHFSASQSAHHRRPKTSSIVRYNVVANAIENPQLCRALVADCECQVCDV